MRAPSTIIAIDSDMRRFRAWLEVSGHAGETPPYQPSLVADYVRARAGTLYPSTLRRACNSLAMWHKDHGMLSPCDHIVVQDALRDAAITARNRGVRPRLRAALTPDKLHKVLAAMPVEVSSVRRLRQTRDKAILLFGLLTGGRRRSEIADAAMCDLTDMRDGTYLYRVPHSKTDQEGHGLTVPVVGPAADALRQWLAESGIKRGQIFRGVGADGHLSSSLTPAHINWIVQRWCKRAGYDPASYGAHSLRAGFVTSALRARVPAEEVAEMTGHKTMAMLRHYNRGDDLCRANSSASSAAATVARAYSLTS